MELVNILFDFVLNIDKHLFEIVNDYRNWTYLLLFCIIFCETGLVVTPFFPGDSLLFAGGAIAGIGLLNIWLLVAILCIAAFAGDSVNYSIGKFFGKKVFERDYRLIKKKYLIQTHDFYEKHGGKTIVIARFVPIVRTFAPFVAGIGAMDYKRFLALNLAGGILWVFLCTFGGYFFGNIPFVKNNFSVVVIAIIVISLLPIVVQYLRHKFADKNQIL